MVEWKELLILIISMAVTLSLLNTVYKKYNLPRSLRQKIKPKTQYTWFIWSFIVYILVGAIWILICSFLKTPQFMNRIGQGIILGVFLSLIPELVPQKLSK